MAEFPTLGRHCDAEYCNMLDFLPIRCDACSGSFCTDHFVYSAHNCKDGLQKSVQVPVCPICNKPVPTPKGVSPDIQVNEHIMNNCEVKKKAIFKNKCTVQGCKKKELVPIECTSCKQNFCLGHRHEKDHNCVPVAPEVKPSGIFCNTLANLRLSRSNGNEGCSAQARNTQVSNDEQLARSLQEQEFAGAGQRRNQPDNCCIF